jgi:hypothetical protein
MLLALLLPLLATYAGVSLFYGSQKTETSTVSTMLENYEGEDKPVLIQENPPVNLPKRTAPRGIGNLEISLYIALLAGVFAFLFHYLRTNLGWVAVLLLSLAFSLWGARLMSLSLLTFFTPTLAFGVLLAVLVRYVFFSAFLLRFRMVVASLAGAALLTLYYRGLYLISGQAFESSNWTSIYVSSVILFVFVTFGMSLADLAIVQVLVRQLRQRKEPLDEEEKDLNA